jgi:putative addiction module component (TIGR02574 family)
MASETRKIEEQAQELSSKDRARLALKLIESLDQGVDEDADELWLDEAERRLADYDAARTEARPADEVLDEIEKKLA